MKEENKKGIMKKKKLLKKGLSRKRFDLWTTVRFTNTVLSVFLCFYF